MQFSAAATVLMMGLLTVTAVYFMAHVAGGKRTVLPEGTSEDDKVEAVLLLPPAKRAQLTLLTTLFNGEDYGMGDTAEEYGMEEGEAEPIEGYVITQQRRGGTQFDHE
uniref:Secreted protein n=1 Tax=Globodera pallida TaxID=36090 RepID=A0A183BNW8_GLOPA